MKTVSIFGSTGSIGQNTLKVLKAQSAPYQIQVLTAGSNAALLARQAIEFNAKKAVIADESLYQDLKDRLSGTNIDCAAGGQAIIDAASQPCDWTMMAIVGMAGLKPLMAAIQRAGIIAIANKEPLVAAGPLVMKAASKSVATILPVDSEHNAIFQVFEQANRAQIERLILTASGGPFLNISLDGMERATPEQALSHPTWSMGDKISIDSATMMNKGLEVIEAHHLFDMPAYKIDVLIHPQSAVHSMVEYADGSVLAQLGASDMCTPITYALGWPERLSSPGQRLDFTKMNELSFEPPDMDRFPALRLAYDCIQAGQGACITLNAANEIAVQAFLDGKIGFLDIIKLVHQQVETASAHNLATMDDIIELDEKVRRETLSCIVNNKLKTQVA